MKRPRPYIPLTVRVAVAERQFVAAGHVFFYGTAYMHIVVPGKRLQYLLSILFKGQEFALDHDPALILRPYNPRIKNVAARYTPNANDPAALVYREKTDHQQKTTGRKPGALKTVTTKGSDIGLKAKFARLEGRTKPRPKRKMPSRPFPKGRKFNAR